MLARNLTSILFRRSIIRDGYETWRPPCSSVHFSGLDGTLVRLTACGYPSLHLIATLESGEVGFCPACGIAPWLT